MTTTVKFQEPDLNRLRPAPALPPDTHSDSAIASEDESEDENDNGSDEQQPRSSPVKMAAAKDSAKGLLTAGNTKKYSINHTTLSNTHSNSMLFRRNSSVGSADSATGSEVPSSNRRKSSVTNSIPSSENEGESSSDSPFRKRISFDTISQPPSANQGGTSIGGFKFSRPSFSSAAAPPVVDETACFSVTSKHVQYRTSYWSRSFLCSMSSLKHSLPALRWLVQNVMENGDELICLRIAQRSNSQPASVYQKEAEKLLADVVAALATSLEIKVVVEVWVGAIKEVVRQAMSLYQPALVVVGTGAGMYGGSMKRYVKKRTLGSYLLAHSVVPVIVIVGDREGTTSVIREGGGKKVKRRSSSEVSDLELPAKTPAEREETAVNRNGDGFNYLSTLINRPILEGQVIDNEPSLTSFNYKSLFQSGAPKNNNSSSNLDPLTSPSAVAPSTPPTITLNEPTISFAGNTKDFEVEPYTGGSHLGASKSSGSMYSNPLRTSLSAGSSRSAGARDKRPSWSARFLPKSLRRFSASPHNSLPTTAGQS